MSRAVTVLFLGGAWSRNEVVEIDGNAPAVDGTNGYQQKVRDFLDAAPPSGRIYSYTDGSSVQGDYPYMFRDSLRDIPGGADTIWNTHVVPNMPVDLVVVEGGYVDCLPTLPAPVSSLNKQISDGDKYGSQSVFLVPQLLDAGANAVMFVPLGTPNFSMDAAPTGIGVVPPGSFITGQSLFVNIAIRTGDMILNISSSVKGVVGGPDLRNLLLPTTSFYALTNNGTHPTEQNVVPNNNGAQTAADAVGAAIDSVPLYLLQPDQDGS